VDWLVPLSVLAAIVIFWRLPTHLTRYRLLLIGSILLSGFMTWQWLTGFDQRPLDRMITALAFSIANLLLVALTVWIARCAQRGQRRLIPMGLIILIGVFIMSKWPAAMRTVLQPLGIPVAAWLGISYLLFRLLHVVLESRRNQLPDLKPGEMIVYALFPASFIAGPIDRFPRFKSDLDQAGQPFQFNFAADGIWLVLIGAFKKFVIADFLAKLPLDLAQYPSVTPAPYLWLALYGYGFLLYFDFSGYTDMAIGVARLIGFHLPENFNAPYVKTNLARFWQSWHITLSFWARDYVFLPLARTLRMRAEWLPANGAALLCHLATMLVIGLWHGFAWTFVAWGVWHGVGLFIVKLWGDWRRPRARRAATSGRLGWGALPTWFLTFNFVMLGWVFFQTSDLSIALTTLERLFGIK
jgi:alginate O-acetyltransferase complex protein AlgI